MAPPTRPSHSVSAPPPPPRRRLRLTPGRVLLWLMKWSLVAGLWGGIILGGVLVWYAYQLPSLSTIGDLDRRPSVTLLSRDGEVFATFGHVYGEPVHLHDLPPALVHAVLSTEDRRFYEHHGIDFRGLGRALVNNARSGSISQGGSTITQQLAKNLFLSNERTFQRKLKEVVISLWLEYHLSKDDILTLYLNRVYFGLGTFGVDGAARRYFGKPARELDVLESAHLVGALKAPSRLNPLRNPESARRRAFEVIDNMVETGFLTPAQAQTVKSRPLQLPQQRTGAGTRFFADWVLDQIPGLIGYIDRDLTVRTTLDLRLQEAGQKLLQDTIAQNGLAHNVSQGALLVMGPRGDVRAMSGGMQYAFSQFNRATQSLRQPGSAFKPIVAAAALKAGWRPDSILDDAPVNYAGWQPKNFDGKFRGPVTLQQVMAESLNVPMVRLADSTGPGAVIQTARALGLTGRLQRNLSLALGTSEVNMLELCTAFARIAANGQNVSPFGIETIEDSYGGLLYERTSLPPVQTLPVSVAQDLQQMLTAAVDSPHGTGRNARLPWTAWGKTGTSQNFRDAWFIGHSRELTAAVWVGNDDNTPMDDVKGGTLPAAIWRGVMLAAFPSSASNPILTESPQAYPVNP